MWQNYNVEVVIILFSYNATDFNGQHPEVNISDRVGFHIRRSHQYIQHEFLKSSQPQYQSIIVNEIKSQCRICAGPAINAWVPVW